MRDRDPCLYFQRRDSFRLAFIKTLFPVQNKSGTSVPKFSQKKHFCGHRDKVKHPEPTDGWFTNLQFFTQQNKVKQTCGATRTLARTGRCHGPKQSVLSAQGPEEAPLQRGSSSEGHTCTRARALGLPDSRFLPPQVLLTLATSRHSCAQAVRTGQPGRGERGTHVP